VQDYSNKADIIAGKLYEEGLVNTETGEFNDERFLEMANEDYEGLKDRLGIIGDFCLFIETNDNPPSIKFIASEDGEIWTGIGSADLSIGNFSCGTAWTP